MVNVTHEGRISPKTVMDTPQVIDNCNMFDIDTLEKSLKYMTVRNYWSLYDIQKKRLNVERFDIPFSEFTQEFRLQTEKQNKMYSRRYVYYLPSQFIDYRERKDYKRSKLYNVPVGFETISENQKIYSRNFLLFINGRFISTAEVLPLEDKTGVIIDVASSNDKHGIPLSKYKEYRNDDAIVTIVFVPNFTWSRHITNRYAMGNNKYTYPFGKFNGGNNITENSLMFINTTDDKSSVSLRRPTTKYTINHTDKMIVFDEDIFQEFDDTNISDSDDMISSYDFLLLNFNKLFKVIDVDETGYFKIDGKMPCPRENMLVFTLAEDGNVVFDDSLEVELYYPNIYHATNGKYEKCRYLVYCFYDEEEITENEEYVNQIKLYEQYVDTLSEYINGNIPQVLKDWYPSEYHYGIQDYDSKLIHLHVPNTLLYKISKMYETIKNDPWALKAYINFLLCPSEKYYVDVSRLDLSIRLRDDTSLEPIVEGTNYVFKEPHYVFAMNRRFLKKSRYDFRIWIDGLFIRNEFYHMELGLDYYYIYIPIRLINKDSMIEIERHKLFDFRTDFTFSNMTDCLELRFDDELVTAYAHDIYVVNNNTNEYIDSSLLQMQVYSKSLDKYVDIESDSFTLLGHGVTKLMPKDPSILNIPLRIGIHKGSGMYTSEVYNKDIYYLGDWVSVDTTNHGNYKSADYRVFNNGKLLLPNQWETKWATAYGGSDSCKTSWAMTKGDQITVDHVPCSFRTVYYQADVPEDGLIDVDGKLNLPINLKWYDIYLNGRRLHSKNITIVSPTKFYIKGVHSRRHLIIYDRNRDNDVFFLSPHYDFDTYDIDRNDTIIDKLMRVGLADIIAASKDPIDDTEPDIGNPGVFGPGVLDAIVYFLEYLKYSYINCNYKLLTTEVKEKFPFYINPDGVMGINANVHPSGVLYKVINCNKGVENMDINLTEELVETGLRELNDRFAITPLHSSNYEFALKGEFLCDPETGGTGIRHNDGTITMIDEVHRKKTHIEQFEQKLILANIGRYSIFDAQFDDTSRVKLYFRGKNLLDNEILIERTNGENIGKIALSIDVTVLQKPENEYFLRWSNHDPSITITYYTGKDHTGEQTYTQVASRLGDRCLEINTPVLVISSIVLNLPDNALDVEVDNPEIESGDGIDLTKGVTITGNNYTDPELPENADSDEDGSTGSDNTNSDESEDCVCLEELSDDSEEGGESDDTTEEPGQDDNLYDPIGTADESEFTDPMRCMVHSILFALKEGGLQL